MNSPNRSFSLVAMSAAFLVVVLWCTPVPAAMDASGQPGVDAWEFPSPPPSDPSLSEPAPSSGISQRVDPGFWDHARNPFAIPDAPKLCSSGVVQACAISTPSD